MIQSRKELKEYLEADSKRFNYPMSWWKILTFSETYRVFRYVKTLRYYEYYLNNRRGILNLLPYIYYKLKHRQLSLKFNITIPPNTTGKGLRIMHTGYIYFNGDVKIGQHATILPMVLLGSKNSEIPANIVIGDNCYVGVGTTILGPVKIGNNVTIGAGAVVTKDIVDNSVVGGIPAKIIKQK